MAKTRINADGDVIRIGNDDDNDEHTPATASGFLRSGGTTLDVFGFNFNLRQFLILLGILSFVFGLRGMFVILGLLGLYTLWNRIAPSGRNSSNGGSNDGTSGRPRRAGESRIRGVKDLPCDPKGG